MAKVKEEEATFLKVDFNLSMCCFDNIYMGVSDKCFGKNTTEKKVLPDGENVKKNKIDIYENVLIETI